MGPPARAAAGPGHWMAAAVQRPGAFTRKAQAAGQSVAGYAAQVTRAGSTASTQTKRQANLAQVFARARNK